MSEPLFQQTLQTEIPSISGSPEGRMKAPPGFMVVDRIAAKLYVKNSTEDRDDGWQEGGGGGGTGTGGLWGEGPPENVQTADPGTTYWDHTAQIQYVKDSGTGNTGWVQVGSAGGGDGTTIPQVTLEVDAMTDLVESGVPEGTLITAAILNDGSRLLGAGHWAEPESPYAPLAITVGPHKFTRRGPVKIGTDTFDPDPNSLSLAVDNSINFQWTTFVVPSGKRKISVGFFVKLTQESNATGLIYDICRIDQTISGAATTCQLRAGNGASGVNFDMNIEVNEPTTHSDRILVAHNGEYWMSMQVDLDVPLAQLAVFNARNGVLAGIVTHIPHNDPGETIGVVHFGNLELGASPGIAYFENMIFDWTDAKFPLFPN